MTGVDWLTAGISLWAGAVIVLTVLFAVASWLGDRRRG